MSFDKVQSTGQPIRNVATGSRRDSRKGKGRFDLIPPPFLWALAVHLENGAGKYGDSNWTKGQPLSWYHDSLMRHLLAAAEGKEDEDHLAAIAWNSMAWMWTLDMIKAGKLPAELDDRFWIPKDHYNDVQTPQEAVQDHPDSPEVGLSDDSTVPVQPHA